MLLKSDLVKLVFYQMTDANGFITQLVSGLNYYFQFFDIFYVCFTVTLVKLLH